jgi:hypothetical protein
VTGKPVRQLVAALAVTAIALATIACSTGEPGDPYVIPGPTGPTPVSTQVPYVWDSRDELSIWVDNKVSRGPISMSGDGRDAAIRIESGPPTFSLENTNSVQWVLRGPDFDAPVMGIRAVSIRYTWTPAIRNSTVPVAIPDMTAAFELPHGRPGGLQTTLSSATVREQSGEMVLEDRYTQPFDARYVYLYSTGGNRGVLEIDSIALVREPGTGNTDQR